LKLAQKAKKVTFEKVKKEKEVVRVIEDITIF
jgi:hypothetical protein